ncbi:MAG: FtsX-like permease family protein [Clostridiales bacterium]|nr:FtsX-like permease family protein [Clostridiales bacterium]
MFWNILKKDLKRKKTMNIILFIFVVLSACFVAAGLSNVVSVMSGTDYYFDLAGMGDYVVATVGESNVGAVTDKLEGESCVTEIKTEIVLMVDGDNISIPGNDDYESPDRMIMIMPVDGGAIKYFNDNNEELTEVKKGEAYLSGNFMGQNDLQPGDTIKIEINEKVYTFTVAGHAKDALLGSDFMGNTRIIINPADWETIIEDDEYYQWYVIEFSHVFATDPGKVKSIVSDVDGTMLSYPKDTFKVAYVLDLITAFIVVAMSLVLVIVSFTVLKFSINFTVMEEFREIGVMKAIGIKSSKIRMMYITKYMMIGAAGAVIGLIASFPFGKLLLSSVANKMVLGSEHAAFMNILGAVVVFGVVILFAYHCTGKVKSLTPLDAIRQGQTGERYNKKRGIRLKNFHGSNPAFLAVNDIMSAPKRFITILLTFCLCTLLVLVLENTVTTLTGDTLASTFGQPSDLYFGIEKDDIGEIAFAEGVDGIKDRLDEMEDKLEDAGIPGHVYKELNFMITYKVGDEKYGFWSQYGVGTDAKDYTVLTGSAPQNGNEIMITDQIAKATGLEIGDTVKAEYNGDETEFIVTGTFQTMNQLGECIRLHQDCDLDLKGTANYFEYQVDFYDDPSPSEIEARKAKITELFDTDRGIVMNAGEFVDKCTSSSGPIGAARDLLLAITFIVIVLVAILMERSFISDEKDQIALLKALGFGTGTVIRWHTLRLGLASFVAVILAAILSLPATQLMITPIFAFMGAGKVDYEYRPEMIFVFYPLLILAVSAAAAFFTSLYTKSVKASDTSNIE